MHAQKYSLTISTACQLQFKTQPMQKRFFCLKACGDLKYEQESVTYVTNPLVTQSLVERRGRETVSKFSSDSGNKWSHWQPPAAEYAMDGTSGGKLLCCCTSNCPYGGGLLN